MKRLLVTTRCIAEVTEDWTFEVPDDFQDPPDWDEWFADWGTVVKLVAVENSEVNHEHDREYRSHHYMEGT